MVPAEIATLTSHFVTDILARSEGPDRHPRIRMGAHSRLLLRRLTEPALA